VLLHDLIPSLYLACWVIFVRKSSLLWKHAVWWLAYPAAYFAYTLLRGAPLGWYPYPFLDANAFGIFASVDQCDYAAGGFFADGTAGSRDWVLDGTNHDRQWFLL
jgi:hypothetical protein